MPIFQRPDTKPVIQFDPRLEISPFTLFRRLRKERAPLLVDVRPAPREWTLRGARVAGGKDWRPETEQDEVVLFDHDGGLAVELADRMQRDGFPRVRALFGGLELYRFSLDPRVVGEETYLVPIGDE